jgi:hypothetical protein
VRLWTYQALTVDNSADRTDGKERSRLRPTEPSGIRSAALWYQTRKSAECREVQSKKSN